MLLLVAIVSVPVMLIAKPYLLWKEDKQRKMAGHTVLVRAVASINFPGVTALARRVTLMGRW